MNLVARTVLGRLGGLLLTLVLASVGIFSAVLLTGDPIAALAGGAKPTPELIERIRDEHRLDEPVWVRYGDWLTGVLHGDFGRSYVYQTDVMTLVAPRFAITLQLVLLTMAIIVVFGVGSGVLAAVRGGGVDRAMVILTSLGMALPTFVVAILMIWIFAKTLGWFPVYGEGGGFWDRLWHLALPAVSLAVLFNAYVSRVTRGSLVAQLQAEHVDTARVRGIPRARIFGVHVFRNAAPQILAISGTTVAGLFAASAIAEVAFGLGGLGSLLVQAAARADLPVVQIVSLLLVAIFVVLNAVADLISLLIDPSSVAGRGRS
ncbi:ABC transporter permease [Microbacterium karelineae]|uniref:ABC transporter permease n=1 Tax=Microbacterium karelineae TaxID=2654283 RepID=UPI001E29B0D4|nr:ABC transporter permease [Microbacterium karelineae]